jgi:hypothetical protein
MRLLVVPAVLAAFVACSGPAAPPEATTEPLATPTPPTPPPAAPAWPADKSALEAMLPAGPTELLVDEMSGESYGTGHTLASAASIAGVPCAAGPLAATDDVWYCTLSSPLSFDNPKVTFKAGVSPALHYGTRAPAAIVLEDLEPTPTSLTIGDVECAEFVHLAADGSLETCTLAKEHAWGKAAIPAGAMVDVDHGKLGDAILYSEATIAGRKIDPGSTVTFGADGAITDVVASTGD